MSRTTQLRQAVAAAVVGLALTVAPAVQAQQAIGVPFIGKNHLSFTVTELSRDGIGAQRAAVFGGAYGRQLNGDDAAVKYTLTTRAAVRALDGVQDGVVDAGITLAATHDLRAVNGLSITGAAGAAGMVWGHDAAGGQVERGRVIGKTPLSAGVAYDLKLGAATIAPFFTLTGAYSKERDYENDQRIAQTSGWRLGNTVGVSVRFRETVLSLSEITGERGMPNKSRMAFTAGVSW